MRTTRATPPARRAGAERRGRARPSGRSPGSAGPARVDLEAEPIRLSRPRHAAGGCPVRGGCAGPRHGDRAPIPGTGRRGRTGRAGPTARRGSPPLGRGRCGRATCAGHRCAPGVVPRPRWMRRIRARWSICRRRTGQPRSGRAPADRPVVGPTRQPQPRLAGWVAHSAAPLPAPGRRAAVGPGSSIGVTVYTPSWSVPANVTAAPAAGAGHERCCGPSGAVTVRPMAPLGMTSSTGARPTASVSRGRAKQLARQICQQDRERHLEREVGSPWLESEDRARQAVPEARVEQRRAARPGDDRARPIGRRQARRLGDVRGRQVDEAQDRLVGVEGPDAGIVSLPATCPRSLVRGGAIARTGAREGRRRKPSKMIRSHGRPSLRSDAGPYSDGLLYSSTFGSCAAVSRYGSPRRPRSVGPFRRYDRPGAVVDGQLVRGGHAGSLRPAGPRRCEPRVRCRRR